MGGQIRIYYFSNFRFEDSFCEIGPNVDPTWTQCGPNVVSYGTTLLGGVLSN